MPLPDPNQIQQQQAAQISDPTKTMRANNVLKQAQEKIEDPSDIGAQLMQAGDNMIQQSYADDAKPDIVDWGAENLPKAYGQVKTAAANFWNNIRNWGIRKRLYPQSLRRQICQWRNARQIQVKCGLNL